MIESGADPGEGMKFSLPTPCSQVPDGQSWDSRTSVSYRTDVPSVSLLGSAPSLLAFRGRTGFPIGSFPVTSISHIGESRAVS